MGFSLTHFDIITITNKIVIEPCGLLEIFIQSVEHLFHNKNIYIQI